MSSIFKLLTAAQSQSTESYRLSTDSEDDESTGSETESTNSSVVHHSLLYVPGSTLRCIECDDLFTSHSDFILHMDVDYGNKTPYQCNQCDHCYATRDSLIAHIETVHEGRRHTQSATSKEIRFQCKYCSKGFDDHSNYTEHLRIHITGEKPFKCSKCHKEFAFKSNMERHQKSCIGMKSINSMKSKKTKLYCICRQPEDTSQVWICCDHCEEWYHPSCIGMTAEQLKVAEAGEFLCPFCDPLCDTVPKPLSVTTNQKASRKRSRKKRTKSKCHKMQSGILPDESQDEVDADSEYQPSSECDEPHQPLRTASELKDITAFSSDINTRLLPHDSLYKSGSTLQCDECRRIFSKHSAFIYHMNSVHGERKPYRCNQCDKCCSKRHSLIAHIRFVHSGERPFECTVCHKAFKRKHHLALHSRMHSKVKPYECSKCGKGHTYIWNMKRHEKCCKRNKTKKSVRNDTGSDDSEFRLSSEEMADISASTISTVSTTRDVPNEMVPFPLPQPMSVVASKLSAAIGPSPLPRPMSMITSNVPSENAPDPLPKPMSIILANVSAAANFPGFNLL